MKMVWEFASVAAGALLVATAQPASALTFTLVDYNGSVAGSAAAQGFQKAADYWSSVITNDVNVRLEIGYTGISGNVIGTAFSLGGVGLSTPVNNRKQRARCDGGRQLDPAYGGRGTDHDDQRRQHIDAGL